MSAPTVRLPVLTEAHPAALPPMYQRWSDELFGAVLGGESEATCLDCAMVVPAVPGQEDSQSKYSFNPKTKCCTYMPELPNWLVGRALAEGADTHPHGVESLKARIAAGVGVSPLGLFQAEGYRTVYSSTVSGFGRSESLLCPHYVKDTGMCGIWSSREATCTTWFCKHDRGMLAKGFWNRFKQFLGVLEQGLARHCYLELDPEAAMLASMYPLVSPREHNEGLSATEIDHGYDPGAYARMWGRWAGREAEFYVECARALGEPSLEQALSYAGSEARVHARITREAYLLRTKPDLPERVRLAGYQVLGATAAFTRVQSYSFLDPLELPQVLVRVLHLFDGRPVGEILEDIERTAGEPCPPEAVRKLLDYQILTAA